MFKCSGLNSILSLSNNLAYFGAILEQFWTESFDYLD